MKDIIFKVIAQSMGCEMGSFSEETPIKEIEGFDSLKYVMMISELQESYSIEIPLDKALEITTVAELAACAKQL